MSLVPRALAALTAPALMLPALVVASAPAHAGPVSDVAYDPAPAAHGAGWLADQLTGGLIHNEQYDFDDYGLSVDAGLALAAVGESAHVEAISTALSAHVASYYAYDVYNDDYSQKLGTHVSAGSLAKAAVLAATAGDDPTSYGGHDLVDELEDRVSSEPASLGRLADVVVDGGAYEADYANTFGQAYAVQALDTAGSTRTDAATDFLLDQQCSAGFFRQELGATTGATCDADGGAASVDATALAILNLRSQADDSDVQTALAKAVGWLTSVQAGSGAYAGDGLITSPNANSTGLAGWALGVSGETGAAGRAAAWLRAHQADDFGPCTTGLTAATGAVAYDDAALATGRSEGIGANTQDQFRRATAQALPALQWAPVGAYSSEPTSDSAYVRGGSSQAVVVESVAPGQTVCVARGASQALLTAGRAGVARGKVTLPAGTGIRTYAVRLTDGVYGHIAFNALGRKTLRPKAAKAKIKQGGTERIVVTGLARGETVTVIAGGKKVASGRAGKAGGFTAKVKIAKKARTGKVGVKVKGQFGDRRGSTSFKVVKR